MTYEEKIEYIRQHREIPDSKLNSILKSIGLIAFSMLAIVAVVLFLDMILTTNKLDNNPVRWFLLPFIAILAYLGISIPFSLKQEWTSDRLFKEIPTNYSAEKNLALCSKLLKNKFRINRMSVNRDGNYIIMHTKTSIWTWENRVTIITDNNRILVNSKSLGQHFSYGQNKRITRKIVKEIRLLNKKNI